MHGFIFLKSEEKQLITSAARLQAVGAGRGRGNAGLGAGLRAGLTAGRSPGAGWPPRPPEAAAGGRGAALWRPGRELPPCPLRAGRAEPSRSVLGRHGRVVPRGADVPGAALPAERLGVRVPERGGGARPGRVPRCE